MPLEGRAPLKITQPTDYSPTNLRTCLAQGGIQRIDGAVTTHYLPCDQVQEANTVSQKPKHHAYANDYYFNPEA
jgi:hypothetical protein